MSVIAGLDTERLRELADRTYANASAEDALFADAVCPLADAVREMASMLEAQQRQIRELRDFKADATW